MFSAASLGAAAERTTGWGVGGGGAWFGVGVEKPGEIDTQRKAEQGVEPFLIF